VIPFVREISFEYGRVDQVSPLIRRVIANNPGPFTYTGTGTYIVGSGEPGAEVAVIDPGPADDAHLRALLAAVEGQRVTTVAITHSHLDHSPLAAPLKAATGATVYGRAVETAHKPFEGPALDDDDDLVFRPDVTGRGRSGAGRPRLDAPGHADPRSRVQPRLLCGWPRRTPYSAATTSWAGRPRWSARPDGDMTAYYASLDRVKAEGFATLWPTHGAPITDPGPFLDAYKAHRLDRERQILEQLAAGRTRITEMVPVMYAASTSGCIRRPPARCSRTSST
jgi:glyoxylase-like metal-dependent hydrolase (beta-lactamase superfamily II)